MREVVHARSIEFLRVRNDRLSSGRILCGKEIFPFDRFTGYKKSNQNQFGRVLPFAFALKCNRIFFFSLLSLILIHSADACIFNMACVDCARACSLKPFLASLRRLKIVFIFPRLVLQILFQIQFGLSYQFEIYHKHE